MTESLAGVTPPATSDPDRPPAAIAPGAGLVTYVQPFYNLQTDRMQGLEALARLKTADGNTQSPAGFFADAQATGQMRRIDLAILDDALGHVRAWHERSAQTGHADLIVSVNLSGELVGHPDFVEDVTAALAHHGVAPDRLLVDIATPTFRRLVCDDDEALARLQELQRRSVTFCLDGFTRDDLDVLPWALEVPVDIIKLHPHEVAGTTHGDAALRELAHAIDEAGLPVVAAGVETPEQLALVRDLGFEWAQGFLLGEPVDAANAFELPARLTR